MDTLNNIVGWMQSKIDQLFSWFGFYSGSYSKLLVYGLLIFLLSKIFKIKLNLNTGR